MTARTATAAFNRVRKARNTAASMASDLIPTPDIMLDLDLDEDERATLRRFTTMRRGHGARTVWIVDEIGGEP